MYLNPLGFLAGNPATLVVGGSGFGKESRIGLLPLLIEAGGQQTPHYNGTFFNIEIVMEVGCYQFIFFMLYH